MCLQLYLQCILNCRAQKWYSTRVHNSPPGDSRRIHVQFGHQTSQGRGGKDTRGVLPQHARTHSLQHSHVRVYTTGKNHLKKALQTRCRQTGSRVGKHVKPSGISPLKRGFQEDGDNNQRRDRIHMHMYVYIYCMYQCMHIPTDLHTYHL